MKKKIKLLPKYGGLTTNTQYLNTSGYAGGMSPNITPNNIQGVFNPAMAGLVGTAGNSMIDAFARPDEINNNKVDVNEGAMAGKGALQGATAGLMFGPLGALAGGLIGGAIGLFGGKAKERRMQGQLDEQNAEQLNNRNIGLRLNTMTQNKSYMPVAKQGGFTVYKGETHKGPNGGILTDEQGNPTGLSNNKPIALTEKNEVSRFNPLTNSTYIYSDSLGFAKPATSLVNKYKLNDDSSLLYSQYKNDKLLQTAVDKQFDNLTTAQEFAKETKTNMKDTFAMFGKGGKLDPLKFRGLDYEVGKEYDISENELNKLLNLGYKIQRV